VLAPELAYGLARRAYKLDRTGPAARTAA
jgi:hypothetical protein